jgi:hypothetical protein
MFEEHTCCLALSNFLQQTSISARILVKTSLFLKEVSFRTGLEPVYIFKPISLKITSFNWFSNRTDLFLKNRF